MDFAVYSMAGRCRVDGGRRECGKNANRKLRIFGFIEIHYLLL